MADRMCKREVVCAQWHVPQESGTFGRIQISRALFRQLGGYDEDMLPVGAQDRDLISRCVMLAGQRTVLIQQPAFVGASIQNSPGSSWRECLKTKMVNVDPAVREKFGSMDQKKPRSELEPVAARTGAKE